MGYVGRGKMQKKVTSDDLGLTAVSLSGSNQSNAISCRGFEQLTIVISAVSAGSATVTWGLEVSVDDGTTWARTQAQAIGAGTVTQDNVSYSKAVTAGTTVWSTNANVNATSFRIVSLTDGTGANATVTAMLGAL